MIEKRTPKGTILKLGKECKKCGHCCSFTSGFVLESEIPKISEVLNVNQEEFARRYLDECALFNTKIHRIKKKGRQCTFLHMKTCKIHRIKPFYCRISNCQKNGEAIQEWFMLNYLVNQFDPISVREWNIRLKIKGTIKGGRIEDIVPDKQLREDIMAYKILR